MNGGGSTLNIQSPNALGSTADGTIVNNYATLQIQGGITTAAEPLTLVGPGVNWNGALRSVSGNNNYTGPITLSGDVRIWVDSDTLTLSGGISGSGANLEVVPVGNLVINSVISTGAGGLTMSGGGVLTLTANNTFTGPTTINAGTVKVDNTTGSATGSGIVTVNSGATLAGSGIIGGPVVVAGGLAPGNSPGILTVNNQVTFQPGSKFSAEVFGLTAGSRLRRVNDHRPRVAGRLADPDVRQLHAHRPRHPVPDQQHGQRHDDRHVPICRQREDRPVRRLRLVHHLRRQQTASRRVSTAATT